nr:hypothetical protein [Streptomyces sp. Rer75]
MSRPAVTVSPSVSLPTMYGPKNPPRLPMELMAAMPTAAWVLDRLSVVSAQNGGSQAKAPIPVTASATTASPGWWRRAITAARPTAPMASGTATRYLRSRVRLDSRAVTSSASAAQM